MTDNSIDIVYEPEMTRAVAYDAAEYVGKCTYVVQGDVWTINHTIVKPEYGGRGIGGMLVAEIVKQARQQNVKINPLCPFAAKEFDQKSEYADVAA